MLKSGSQIRFKYSSGDKIFSLSEIVDTEERFQNMAQRIKEKNLSPLEQLIAVYDIAKIFKPYKEGDSSADSRALYEFLNNDYMVCAGYADFIVNMGHRLGAQYTEIRLITNNEGHARNYVNIVDEKYGINGFYVLDPTWEQDGMPRGESEPERSTYRYFMLTTQQGREPIGGFDPHIQLDDTASARTLNSYDLILTMDSPEKITEKFKEQYFKKEWFRRIQMLDPDFYKELITLDFNKKEDAQVLIDYFKTKVNKPISKDTLLDAVMNVKKIMNPNLSVQDLEDMRMEYSMTPPYCNRVNKNDNSIFAERESLYGQERYEEYIERRYEELKGLNIEQASAENICLNIETVYNYKRKQTLSLASELGKINRYGLINIDNPEFIQKLSDNSEMLESLGIEFKQNLLVFPRADMEKSMEENMNRLSTSLNQVYDLLGIEREDEHAPTLTTTRSVKREEQEI